MSTCSPCIPHLLLRSISMILFGPPLRRMQLKRLIMNIIRGLTLLFYPTGMMIDDESLPPSPQTAFPQPNSDLQLTEKKNSLAEMLKRTRSF